MKVNVNKDKCIGCGYCTNVADEVFSFSDDGYAQADNSKITDSNIEDVKVAIESCPVEAIEETN